MGNTLMEDRNTTERPTRPLCEIRFEPGVDGLKKWAHKRDLESGPSNGTLALDVDDYPQELVGRGNSARIEYHIH